MGLLSVLSAKPGFVKATFQGPQGSGKTFTAVKLAVRTRQYFGIKTPVAFFDTETGSDYVAGEIEKGTGLAPLRVKTRAFSDLRQVVAECVAGAAGVLIIDSITHVWRELNDAYMRKQNETRRFQKSRMDIQDIMQVKALWAPWPDEFLNSPLHIIVCGREGNEWGNEENEETGKRELVTVGKKMKVEGEFGYEASLMCSMSVEQISAARVKRKNKTVEMTPRRFVNVMTVLKDRFNVMNGQAFEFPTGETFDPFLKCLTPGQHSTVDTTIKSQDSLPGTDDRELMQYKREKEIALEEIQGEIVKHYPGQSAKEKACKAALLEKAFTTRSWTRVENTGVDALNTGLKVIRQIMADREAFERSMLPTAE